MIKRKVIFGFLGDESNPLLIRYYLFNTPWFRVYLHHLLRSDEDRHMHDHPWWFWTVLLTGNYIEHVPVFGKDGMVVPNKSTTHKRNWLSVLFRPATWIHRLEMDKPMWTLVIAGNAYRDWGFYTEDGWIRWQLYSKYTEMGEIRQ